MQPCGEMHRVEQIWPIGIPMFKANCEVSLPDPSGPLSRLHSRPLLVANREEGDQARTVGRMSHTPSVPPDLMSLLQQHDDFAEEMTRTLMAISERIKRLEERIETLEGGTST